MIAFSVFVHALAAPGPTAGPPAGGGSFLDGYVGVKGDMISFGGIQDGSYSPYLSTLLIYSVSTPSNPISYSLDVKDKDSINPNDLLRVTTSGIAVFGTTTFSNDLNYKLQVHALKANFYASHYAEPYSNLSGFCEQYPANYECTYGILVYGTTTVSSTLRGDYDSAPSSFKAKIFGFDSISANSIIFSGTKNASTINSGAFPNGGNYAFPGGLGISTSSVNNLPGNLSVYSDIANGDYNAGYFTSSTYIRINPTNLLNPGVLNVGSSTSPWLAAFTKGIRLDRTSAAKTGHPVLSFGSGAGGSTYYGIGYKNDRLYFFSNDSDGQAPITFPKFYNLTISTSSIGIGIGERTPSSTLHVSGTLLISGSSTFQFTTTTTSGFILTSDAEGNGTWQAAPAGISGTGTNYTPRNNGAGWIGSSLLTNSSTIVIVGTSTEPNDGLTLLRVGPGGYFQFDKTSIGDPESGECNSASEVGRLTIDIADNELFLCTSSSGWKKANFWYTDTSFNKRQKITIDRSKISGTPSNFPVMIKTTAPAAAQDDCDDILFTDSAGAKIAHQIEKDSTETTTCASGNTFVAWVNTSLNSNVTTTLFMYYGSSTASNQQLVSPVATAVWDSNFKAVWHLQELSTDGSTISNKYLDSTSNGILANQVKGDDISTPMFRGVHLGASATTTDYISRTNSSLLDGNDVTVSGWVKFNSLMGASTTPKGIIARDNANDAYNILFDDVNNKVAFFVRKDDVVDVWSVVSSTASVVTSTSNWYHLVLTHTANTLKGYVNSQLIGSNTNTLPVLKNISQHVIGRYGGANYHWIDVDEVRYSNTARSQDWITTEYNNQSSPSTFYTIGAEE